ncbi:hypothetical protein HPC38_07600 [Pasteurellaceae bacterium HPA106]|uniref:hypothetical protein n=1 Tax=Spirabiliibacterium pneumoniae TaxID=221400 RepID=UPI001AAC838D|nr:hypothetical protein [Spirabiliibacterium pneumoniae]MBE2896736.1 hypothetical protein [Spirabiliibacterium pneumoniae]
MKLSTALLVLIFGFILLPLVGFILWFFGSLYYDLYTAASIETLVLGIMLGGMIGFYLCRK